MASTNACNGKKPNDEPGGAAHHGAEISKRDATPNGSAKTKHDRFALAVREAPELRQAVALREEFHSGSGFSRAIPPQVQDEIAHAIMAK
jgi:hypothetical protein